MLYVKHISLVNWNPPTGITEVYAMDPFLKATISVVPPPISTMAAPFSFCFADLVDLIYRVLERRERREERSEKREERREKREERL